MNDVIPRLQIPSDLSGKSFLQIGCTDRQVCDEARERGADVVVGLVASGIDHRRTKAWRGNSEISFVFGELADLPDQTYDLIHLSSSSFPGERLPDLIDYGLRHLNSDGLLIVQVIAYYQPVQHWIESSIEGKVRLIPTLRLVTEDFLSDFSVRLIDQIGLPPLPEYILHCNRFQPIVILLGGKSRAGKTVLANEVARGQVHKFETDHFLQLIASGEFPTAGPLCDLIKAEFSSATINKLTKRIVEQGLGDELAALLVKAIPRARVTVVEGYSVTPPEISEPLVSRLSSAGFRLWRARPE